MSVTVHLAFLKSLVFIRAVKKKQKKRMPEQHVNETFHWQGFKTKGNNVLLWLRISDVSR